jgi:hypothetical protein
MGHLSPPLGSFLQRQVIAEQVTVIFTGTGVSTAGYADSAKAVLATGDCSAALAPGSKVHSSLGPGSALNAFTAKPTAQPTGA